MTTRGMSVVALAAGMVLGGAGLAPAQDADQQQQQQKAGQDPSAQQTPEQGRQIDLQILQQLQQLQQQPDQAPDKLFVIGAAIDNMYEMQLTHQAMQKAQNQQVKQLAQRLMEDHQQMSTQLQQVARQMNVQVPQGLPSIKQQEVQVIASLPAEQFEKQYVAKMNEQHSKDVTCFGSQMSLAQSQQLKQFVTQQLPKLQQHQQQVLQTAAAIGITNQAEAQQAGSRQPAERQQQDRQQQDQQR